MASKTRKGIVYKFTNLINGKVYIGQTINEKRRLKEHKFCKNDFYFHRAINKYGWKSFAYEVLETITATSSEKLRNKLNEREIYYIALFNSTNRSLGYNLTRGGDNVSISKFKPVQKLDPVTGVVLENFESIREAYRSLNISPRGDISSCCKGIRGIAHGFKWQYYDEDERNKYPVFTKTESKRSVAKVDKKTGKILEIFESIAAANKSMGKDINDRSISRCCNNRQDSAFGFKWVFTDPGKYENSFKKGEKVLSKEVFKYNLKTGAVLEKYSSIYDAARKNNIPPYGISRCINNRAQSYKGFGWTNDKNNIKPLEKKSREGVHVLQIDSKTGQILEEFPSLLSAARSVNLVTEHGIRECCNGNRKTSGGYMWRYAQI